MKIEIKLNNCKYCNRCPLLRFCAGTPNCENYGRLASDYEQPMNIFKDNRYIVIRPKKCIKENG